MSTIISRQISDDWCEINITGDVVRNEDVAYFIDATNDRSDDEADDIPSNNLGFKRFATMNNLSSSDANEIKRIERSKSNIRSEDNLGTVPRECSQDFKQKRIIPREFQADEYEQFHNYVHDMLLGDLSFVGTFTYKPQDGISLEYSVKWELKGSLSKSRLEKQSKISATDNNLASNQYHEIPLQSVLSQGLH
ncbi:hypothetical protein Ciccas_010842, partial [Cichlidogyrus casuarinus]